MYLHLHTFYRDRNGQKQSDSVSFIIHICHLRGQVAIKLAYGFLKCPERNKYSLES
ncbi:hypothetical protein SAMN05421863_101932 [Nitrosomonas communis]|uniref:Uncharacterized protein n=1 Tax=Nitrosomonas communis TaxID=44574 RepID=A0A1I4PD11_9PROT|nr:hypothetical protein SAMN05421863_101932 [Nitrosomonas communis]